MKLRDSANAFFRRFSDFHLGFEGVRKGFKRLFGKGSGLFLVVREGCRLGGGCRGMDKAKTCLRRNVERRKKA